MTDKKLIIFSKAPVPGQVKTRLIPAIGEKKATQLHQYMLEQTVAMTSGLKNIDCELHCTPNINHVFFDFLSKKYNIKLVSQKGSNLGDKMSTAINLSLEQYQYCVLIGTDCPGINPAYIYQAFDKLSSVDIILGPVQDGGYVLIGGKTFDQNIFSGVSWSTPEVLTQTVKNIILLQLKYHKLDTLSDIDTGEDLNQLSKQYLHNAFS